MKLIATLISLIAFSSLSVKADSSDGMSWERQIVAACLVLEASDQGEEGMRAVASVIRNRAETFGPNILGVVRKPYAFTSLNAASTGRTGSRGYADHVRKASNDRNWKMACAIVNEMYSDEWADVTYGADHYVRSDLRPHWAGDMSVTAIIGKHMFFSSVR